MADHLADWRDYWAETAADIRFTLGVEPETITDDQVVMRMPFKPEIGQATGLFSAGALVQLADIAATWLCLVHLRNADAPEGTFPFAVQLSVNLVANTRDEDALATAQIVSARPPLIVPQPEVHGEGGRPPPPQPGPHLSRPPR